MIVTTSVVEPALTDCPSDRPTDTTVPLMGLVSCASARSSWALINDALAESIDAWSLASCWALSEAVDPSAEEEEPWSDGVVEALEVDVGLEAGVEPAEGLAEAVLVLARLVVEAALDVVPGVAPLDVAPAPVELGPSAELAPDDVDVCAPVNSLASVASACATTV